MEQAHLNDPVYKGYETEVMEEKGLVKIIHKQSAGWSIHQLIAHMTVTYTIGKGMDIHMRVEETGVKG